MSSFRDSQADVEDSDVIYIEPPPPPMIDLTTFPTVFTLEVRQRILLMSREIIDLTEPETPPEDIQIERSTNQLLQTGRTLIQHALAILSLAQPDVIELTDTDDDVDDDVDDSNNESSSSSSSSNEHFMDEVIKQLRTLDFKKNVNP